MSKIDDMIKQLCPDGVERVKLGETCSRVFAGGTPSTKHDEYYDGDIPWIRSGEIDFNRIYSAERNITKEGYENSSAKMMKAKCVVMAMTGATVAKVATVEIPSTANQSVCSIEPNTDILDYRFLFFYLANSYIKIKGSAQGALTSLNLQMIKAIEIPLPPLPIQEEIVRILDKFTTIQESLDEEITLRQKQLEYYREKLLTFKDGNVFILSSIMGVERGKRLVRGNLEIKGEIPVYQNSLNPLGYYKSANRRANTPFVISAGAAGEVGFSKVAYWAADDCFTFSEETNIIPQFLYYTLKVKENYLKSQIRGGAIKRLPKDIMEKLLISIPSFEKQQEIVTTLDKFETLVTKLKEARDLRQKQYEYYREKLLTF